ncbi:MAG: glycosyltransferase family 2 protein [Nitrososphaerota archaeon]
MTINGSKFPLVSVITPIYNRASFLPRVWQSLKAQTEGNFEWIIVDDGSTDNTPELVEQLQKEDNCIRYIRFNTNKGINFVRAKGAEESKVPYLVFLDSDDTFYDSNTLAVMLSEIRSTPDDIGAVAFIAVDEHGKPMAFLEQDRIILGYEEIVCEQKAKGEFIMICKRDYLNSAPWSPYQGLESLHRWARARLFRILYIKSPGIRVYGDASNRLTGAVSTILNPTR